MNFYRFIDSADVRGYLEEKQYAFSPLEAAFVVWQSRVATLEEKHAAWREIIETMPDTDISCKRWKAPRESLHAFLRDYMALEDRLIRGFYDSTGLHAYSYYEPEYYSDPKNCGLLVDHRRIYHTLDECLEDAKTALKGYHLTLDECLEDAQTALKGYDAQEIILYRIDLSYGHRVHAAFNTAGNVLRVRPEYELFEPEEAILRDSFVTLSGELSFPLPFHNGDILYDPISDRYFAYEEDGAAGSAGTLSCEFCPEEEMDFVLQTVLDKSHCLKGNLLADRLYKNENCEKNALVLLIAMLAVKFSFPFRFCPPDLTPLQRSSDGFYGVPELDRNCSVNFSSDLIGLASFGGVLARAKDDFILRTVLHHAVDRRENVLFISMQMRTSRVWERLLKLLSGCDLASANGFSPEELERLWNAYYTLLGTRLTIVDSPSTDAEEVEYRLKYARPDLVVIDRSQQFNPIPELEGQRERMQYTHIVYTLKQLAKEYDTPIMLTSDLPRPPGFIPGQQPEPTLHDFNRMVSNADFDQILLVHAERGSTTAKLSLVKNRYGDCIKTTYNFSE